MWLIKIQNVVSIRRIYFRWNGIYFVVLTLIFAPHFPTPFTYAKCRCMWIAAEVYLQQMSKRARERKKVTAYISGLASNVVENTWKAITFDSEFIAMRNAGTYFPSTNSFLRTQYIFCLLCLVQHIRRAVRTTKKTSAWNKNGKTATKKYPRQYWCAFLTLLAFFACSKHIRLNVWRWQHRSIEMEKKRQEERPTTNENYESVKRMGKFVFFGCIILTALSF